MSTMAAMIDSNASVSSPPREPEVTTESTMIPSPTLPPRRRFDPFVPRIATVAGYRAISWNMAKKLGSPTSPLDRPAPSAAVMRAPLPATVADHQRAWPRRAISRRERTKTINAAKYETAIANDAKLNTVPGELRTCS